MTAYCNKKGLDMKAVRFRYEIYLNHHHPAPVITFFSFCSFDGTRLRPDDSIMTIPDLQDGDTIEVFTEQQGGGGKSSDGPQ